MNIGECIKEARKRAGLTQKELGNRLGVSAANISAFENNKTNIKPSTIAKIANALGCKPIDIVHSYSYKDDKRNIFYNHYFYDGAEAEEVIIGDSKTNKEDFCINVNQLDNDPDCIFYTSIPDNFIKLNRAGREEAIKRIEELTYIVKYTFPDDEE